jgi:hypothetical protein
MTQQKTATYLWYRFPARNMERIVMGTLLDDFLEIGAIIGDIIFFMGLQLLITFHTVGEIKGVFWATAEEKTRAWPRHQVHKERLNALQTSAWGVWTECSDFHQ